MVTSIDSSESPCCSSSIATTVISLPRLSATTSWVVSSIRHCAIGATYRFGTADSRPSWLGKDLGVPDDLSDVASRVFDRWFERLWTAHRLEIEVAPARRLRRLRVQEGLRLYAPFGLRG